MSMSIANSSRRRGEDMQHLPPFLLLGIYLLLFVYYNKVITILLRLSRFLQERDFNLYKKGLHNMFIHLLLSFLVIFFLEVSIYCIVILLLLLSFWSAPFFLLLLSIDCLANFQTCLIQSLNLFLDSF